MGMFDDAKETLEAAAKKAGRAVEDGVDRLKDKTDQVTADAKAKAAAAEAESVHKRNEVKEDLR